MSDLRLQIVQSSLSFSQRAFSLDTGGRFVGQGGLKLLQAVGTAVADPVRVAVAS